MYYCNDITCNLITFESTDEIQLITNFAMQNWWALNDWIKSNEWAFKTSYQKVITLLHHDNKRKALNLNEYSSRYNPNIKRFFLLIRWKSVETTVWCETLVTNTNVFTKITYPAFFHQNIAKCHKDLKPLCFQYHSGTFAK